MIIAIAKISVGMFLGRHNSYLHTIGAGRDIACRRNWNKFSLRDRDILLGLRDQNDTGIWGLLGNLRGAGRVVGKFTTPRYDVLNCVLEQIDVVTNNAGENFIEYAHQAVQKIMSMKGVGPAAATRFLSLARPDRLISVNGKVSSRLIQFSNLQVTNEKQLVRNYDVLLRTLYSKKWFNSPEPNDALQREIWCCRAALVDAFVYIPTVRLDA